MGNDRGEGNNRMSTAALGMPSSDTCLNPRPLERHRGGLRASGLAYGQAHAEDIRHVTQAMVRPSSGRLRHAEACWAQVRPWHRPRAGIQCSTRSIA